MIGDDYYKWCGDEMREKLDAAVKDFEDIIDGAKFHAANIWSRCRWNEYFLQRLHVANEMQRRGHSRKCIAYAMRCPVDRVRYYTDREHRKSRRERSKVHMAKKRAQEND